jgi:hypothetical protein
MGVERRWCRHATNYNSRSEAFWKGGDAQPLKKRVLQGKLGICRDIRGYFAQQKCCAMESQQSFKECLQ